MPAFHDITGQRFGRLIVLAQYGRNRWGSIQWQCLCECGNEAIILSQCLRRGWSRSCGCIAKNRIRNLRLSHGKSKTKTYRIWKAINERCNNPNNKSYKYYGGRGIKSLYNSVSSMIADIGEQPSGYTIHRLNNDGHYEPGNCNWISRSEHAKLTNSRRPRRHRIRDNKGRFIAALSSSSSTLPTGFS